MKSLTHFGVVVGIDKYLGFSDLRCAKSDAEAMYEWLCKDAELTADNCTLVAVAPEDLPEQLSPESARPDDDTIWRALDEKIYRVNEHVAKYPEDWSETRLYVFFSGHGIAPTGVDVCGLAANADNRHLGYNISFKGLKEWLIESAVFAEVVIIADCCRTKPPVGPIGGYPPWSPSQSMNGNDVKFAEFYATIYGNPAREPRADRDPNAERGYYTRALLEGLRGDVAVDATGSITTESLATYAWQRVIDLTDGKQKPAPYHGASLHLSGPRTSAPRESFGHLLRTPVTIHLPAGFSGRVRVLDGSLHEVSVHEGASGILLLRLRPGLYQVLADSPDAVFAGRGLFDVPDKGGELDVTL